MSKRAPNAVTVPVRRATQPSTPSSTSATDASARPRPVRPIDGGRDRERPAARAVSRRRVAEPGTPASVCRGVQPYGRRATVRFSGTRDGAGFWCASPGAARSARARSPRPARTTSWCAHCTPGSAAAPSRSSSVAACPPKRDGMRAPFQEGSSPAGEVRLPQRRRGRGRARPRSSAGPCSACTRTRRRTSCPRARSWSCPTACRRARAVLAGAVETALNALWDAAPLVGDRVAWSAPAWSAAASPGCWPRIPGAR